LKPNVPVLKERVAGRGHKVYEHSRDNVIAEVKDQFVKRAFEFNGSGYCIGDTAHYDPEWSEKNEPRNKQNRRR
jgi:hypothetical protein